jgi:hypothetical protein
MYSWLWQRLPGSTPIRAALAATVAVAVVAALWFWVFPWAASHLPLDGTAFTG